MIFKAALLSALVMMAASSFVGRAKREVCKEAPIELGIVLDSSVSIAPKDFQKGKEFLIDLVKQFEIGPTHTRVSFISYARGVYTDQAFELDTYTNSADLEAALEAIVFKQGDYTATGKGISYMADNQLARSKCRPGVPRVSIVITDGNSQEPHLTAGSANAASSDGIDMFALGVGKTVSQAELLRIAAEKDDHVITATSYSELMHVIPLLKKQVCKDVPTLPPVTLPPPTTTTTPAPQNTGCRLSGADIHFILSQKSLGLEGTSIAVDFINAFMRADDFERVFRYGVISDTCDSGFELGLYDDVLHISNRLQSYYRYTLPSLVEKLVVRTRRSTAGTCGNSDESKIAVIFTGDGQKTAVGIQGQVDDLVSQGVQVFVVDITGLGVTVRGARTITGTSGLHLAHILLQILCE